MADAKDSLMRGVEKRKAVRVMRNVSTGKMVEVVADVPYGRGWHDGSWLALENLGWKDYEKVQADKHAREVEAKKAEEAKRAAEEAAKKEKK